MYGEPSGQGGRGKAKRQADATERNFIARGWNGVRELFALSDLAASNREEEREGEMLRVKFRSKPKVALAISLNNRR